MKREPFDPLDGIARCAPCSGAGSCKDCGTRSLEIGGEIAGQRIEFAKAKIERKGPMQRSILRLQIRAWKPRDRDDEVVALSIGGHPAKYMQAVADLHLLEIAEMRVERAQGVVGRRIPRHIDVRIEPLRPRQRQNVFGEHGGTLGIEIGGQRIFVDQVSSRARSSCNSARVIGGVR